MTEEHSTTVGPLPNASAEETPGTPQWLTRVVWLLCAGAVGVLGAHLATGATWTLEGVAAVDGLTLTMWVAVTFFSGVVHSYALRYMAGSKHVETFFLRVFAFTLVVLTLVAADHVLLFVGSWLAMGLVMADLIGHVRDWPQAQAAASLARRSFLASTALLSVALAALWSGTGAVTVSGMISAVGTVPTTTWLVAVAALVGAAVIQSALLPAHAWLLSSMTAPTPASALMHAGFVNAGGVLLVRFGPVISLEPTAMLAIVAIGAASALGGKLLKSVQSDVKRKLGCSTVGQMGFMIMQVGLGFFGAAITHLVLHGFYKAYQFLSAGEQVEHTSPTTTGTTSKPGVAGLAVTAVTAVAGGGLFALLTGKGMALDTGLLLAGLVALTTLHATRDVAAKTELSATLRYGVVPALYLGAIAVYAAAYTAISGLLGTLPLAAAPAELTPVHGVVAVAFALVYLAIESDLYERSERLYVALLNSAQPATDTLLTASEDYNEY